MLVASFSKRSCALLLTYIALLLIAVTVTASRPKPHGKHEGTKPEPVMDSTTGSTTAPKTDKTDMGEPAPGNFSSSKVQVILARYSEQLDHLDWLTKYTHTIYNRGKDIEVPFKLNEVKVYTNFGKESFIYLDHIIEHYDNLAEIMVFSQASQDFGNQPHIKINYFEYLKLLKVNPSIILTPSRFLNLHPVFKVITVMPTSRETSKD